MDDLVHLDTSCLKNQKKILDKICLKILLHTYSNMQKRCFCTWNQCLQYIEPVPLHAEPMVLQVEPLPLQLKITNGYLFKPLYMRIKKKG